MAQYIQVTAIKRKLHNIGKRVPPSYIAWLDEKVSELVESHARSIGHRKTMSISDLEAATEFNKHLPERGLTR